MDLDCNKSSNVNAINTSVYSGIAFSQPTNTIQGYVRSYIDDFAERKQLIWDSITDESLPEIDESELIKILDMIKSTDKEAVVLGFRLLQGHRIPKNDFITNLILKDACAKLINILHEDYSV